MTYEDILKQTIDLHVHVGPEIIPRLFTVPELVRKERGKLRGAAVKNHFFPTSAQEAGETGAFRLINSIVLNRYQGGIDHNAVLASAQMNDGPIIVWFPTIHAEPFLSSTEYEIPPEWVDQDSRRKIRFRKAKDVAPLTIRNVRGDLLPEVADVLEVIREYDAILATGHVSWQEARTLVKAAIERYGIRRVIVTHPIYQRIRMPIAVQKELARCGAYIEHCYSMYAIDKIPMRAIAAAIMEVGPRYCILSSDVGQRFSPCPSDALREFMRLLEQEGIRKEDMKTMLVENPAALVGRR